MARRRRSRKGLEQFRGRPGASLEGERTLLLLFPNVFEPWFLVVAAVHRFRPGFTWRPAMTAAVLAVLLVVKEAQEWALHGARLFDGISSLEFLDAVRRWLTGGS